MSERVRKARALDYVERVIARCCEIAVGTVMESPHVQVELAYDVLGAIDEAAEVYSVDYEYLVRESMRMLHDDLQRNLRPVCEVRYVKPYQKDGRTVGMEAKVYKLERRTA